MRNGKGQRTVIGLLLCLGVLTACGAPVISTLPAETPTVAPAVLNVYNWDTYIDPTVLTGFEQKFGARVNYTTFLSNEELIAALQSGSAYDVVVPSGYAIDQLWRGQLLYPLNKDNIPNLKNIAPQFANPSFDPGNRYCAPYLWWTMGIGYNKEKIGHAITGWHDFFDPAYAGRIALLDGARDTLGVALVYLGYSPNTTSAPEILAARDFLLAQLDNVAVIALDDGQDLLAAGEVDLVVEWGGDMFQVMAEHPELEYVIPLEGSTMGSEGMCIPAAAEHKQLAELFINYVLEPEVSAAIANYTRYPTPNQAALPLINLVDRNNPAIYPAAEIQARLFMYANLGPEVALLYEQAWADIHAVYDKR